MMKKTLSILMILAFVHVKAQSNIKVGKKAPIINITDWITNVPKDKTLKGKKVVLEFWATWCGPCIAAIPHLNELQTIYKNRDLYYVSITDEPIAKVNRILKRVDFKSIVVSDQTRKTQISFGDGKKGLEAYPLTVLIDNNGIVKWIGEPKNLNQTVMNDFVGLNKSIISSDTKSKAVDIKIESDEDRAVNLLKDKSLMYYFEFRKSNKGEPNTTKVGNKLVFYSNKNFSELYANLLNIDQKNLIVSENITNQKFDLIYKNSKGNPEDIIKLDNEILSIMGLQKENEKKIVSVLKFSLSEEALLEKAVDESFSSKSDAGDKIVFTSYTVPNLIKDLNSYSSERLYFEGDSKGKFDFIIEIKSTDALINSLKSYGLTMHRQDRNIEVLKLETKE